MALGSAALLDWLASRPDVVFRGADHTHEVRRDRPTFANFVSINSAVEVDLFGQVNAESVARQADFRHRRIGRLHARGESVARRPVDRRDDGDRARRRVSRIVPRVELVTALRTDVDLVVTEYRRGRAEARVRRASARNG